MQLLVIITSLLCSAGIHLDGIGEGLVGLDGVAEVKSTIESCSSRFIGGVELRRQEIEGKMVSRLMEGGVIAGECT